MALAVESINVAMVKLLSEAGADPTIEGNMADTAIAKAERLSRFGESMIFETLKRALKKR